MKIIEEFSDLVSKFNQLGPYQSFIGIDIGTSAVKCVEFVERRGQKVLIKASLVGLQQKDIKEHKKETILNALKKALSGMNTQRAQIVCVLSSPQIFTRSIIVPLMPRQELSNAIRWEMKNFIPFPIEEASLDFQILKEIIDQGVKKWNVEVAVCPEREIDELLEIFSSLGIKLSAIVPMASALGNIVEKLNLSSCESIAVIEMGAQLTELNIFRQGRLSFSRKLPVTATDLTQAMTYALTSDQGMINLTFEEAEKIKCLYGLPGQLADQGLAADQRSELIEGKITAAQIFAFLRPKLEQLVEEIERSFNFYREEIHADRVEKVILLGGGSQLKGLPEFLERELGIEVKLGNILKSIKVSEHVLPPQEVASSRFNLALGAALGTSRTINLLPAELKHETQRLAKKISIKAACAAAITLILLFYIGMNIQLQMYEKKLAAAKGEFSAFSVEIKELREKIWMEQILKNEPFWDDVLKELSHIIPDNMYLTYLAMDFPNSISFKGVITKGNEDAQMALSSFMLKLEEGLFKNVALVNTQKKMDNLISSEFEIKCNLDRQ